MRHGDVSALDDAVIPDLQKASRFTPLEELGSTGLNRAAGVIDEEFLPALRGRKAVKVYREMSLNDPIVGSLLFAIEQLLKQVSWRVEAADNSPESQAAAKFVETCMEDMSHSWADMISEVLSMLIYGWSWHEITYKRRIGPWEDSPKSRSKYSDGAFGWRKISIRAQETMVRWIFDDEGGIKAMVQLAPPDYKTVVIPINKSLLFKPKEYKGSPEGVSLLRNAYRPWFFKKRLEEFEAIGVERDLAGMPVAKVPAEYMTAKPGTENYRTYQAFKKLVSGVRRDEHEGLVLPNQYDRETKQPLFEFELMSSGGARQFDTSGIIQRYEQRILMTVLADFIMVGHEGSGSYALHVDKTGIFRAALNGIAKSIADVFNRHAIPRLFAVNGWKLAELPTIEADNVDSPDLTQLSQFMSAMAGMGMEWFPDPELEKFLRSAAGLPDLDEDQLMMRQQMAEQYGQLNMANTGMELAGAQQKYQLVSERGFTPEQAMMASQSPTPEMMAQDQEAQYLGQYLADLNPEVAQMRQQELMMQNYDPQAELNQGFEREKFDMESQKMGIADQYAAAAHEREKEKMGLQAEYDQFKTMLEDRKSREQAKFEASQQKEQDKATERQARITEYQQRNQDKRDGAARSHERVKMSHEERMAKLKMMQQRQASKQQASKPKPSKDKK